MLFIDNFKKSAISIYRRGLRKDVVSLYSPINSDSNILLSYITRPFQIDPESAEFSSHTNKWECIQIAQTWIDHGYNVDIIDYDNDYFKPKKEYSFFIDIHSNMERLAPLLGNNCKKILHITGAYWEFQNSAEKMRLSSLKERRGFNLIPRSQVPQSRGIEFADCATILGNEFTKGTFSKFRKKLYEIPLSTTVEYPFFEKDFNQINKNYLWFGSSSMVHKGLDLVLDLFREMPDYNLTVCGNIKKEKDFEKAYHEELYCLPNIRTLDFVDVRSDLFMDVIKNTTALIFPSCSEGQSGCVVTCMHAGLIPIVSYESGVNVSSEFGMVLKENTIDEMLLSIQKLSQNPTDELQRMSKEAWLYARTHHTRENFSRCYNNFVDRLIK